MDIDISSAIPYLVDSIKNHILYLEDWAKDFEISRRLVAASAAKSEQERVDIVNASTDFTYTITVEAAASGINISFERNPLYEDTQTLNDIAKESYIMFESLLPEEIECSTQECIYIIGEHIEPIISEYMREKLFGGAL